MTETIAPRRPPIERAAIDRLQLDFLYLDLTACDRCVGTDRNLESALDLAREVLEATGVEVEVNKIHVESAAQARGLRFVSSPTIRVNGRDLAFELKESACGCDACTDAAGAPIACRDWTYRGEQYTEAPVGLIVDAILAEVYGGAERPPTMADDAYELPENLKRFFAGGASCGSQAEAADAQACCEPVGTADCCAPSTARETSKDCGC